MSRYVKEDFCPLAAGLPLLLFKPVFSKEHSRNCQRLGVICPEGCRVMEKFSNHGLKAPLRCWGQALSMCCRSDSESEPVQDGVWSSDSQKHCKHAFRMSSFYKTLRTLGWMHNFLYAQFVKIMEIIWGRTETRNSTISYWWHRTELKALPQVMETQYAEC